MTRTLRFSLSPCGRGCLSGAIAKRGRVRGRSLRPALTPHPARFARHPLPQGEREERSWHGSIPTNGLGQLNPDPHRFCERRAHLGRLAMVVAEFLEPLLEQRIVLEFFERNAFGVQ